MGTGTEYSMGLRCTDSDSIECYLGFNSFGYWLDPDIRPAKEYEELAGIGSWNTTDLVVAGGIVLVGFGTDWEVGVLVELSTPAIGSAESYFANRREFEVTSWPVNPGVS